MKIKSHIPRKYALLFLLIITMFSVKSQGGQLDLSFAVGSGFGGFATIRSIAIQSDGKILAAGTFTSYNGTAVNGIARINVNGTIDNSFNPGLGFNQGVWSLALQSDGKIIAGGDFTSYNGIPCKYIVRLNTNGSIDATFDTGTGFDTYVWSIAIQTDGKIIAGGYFSSFNGTPKNNIARLNSNGSIDPLFNIGAGFNNYLYKVLIQPDGKILTGGSFTTYNGTGSKNVARINTDGTLDATFSTIGTGFNASTRDLALQSDGKIIVGGYFSDYNGISYSRLARLNTNGTLDATFNIGSGFNSTVHSLAIQSNGKIIVGGEFTNFDGNLKNCFVRLNTNGTFDTSFDTGLGLQSGPVTAYSLKIQPDGKILLGGNFSSYNGVSRNKIARVNTVCIAPTITISASSNPVCAGSTTTLMASGASSYTWNPGNITGPSIIANPTGNTTYTVTANSGTCTSTNTLSLIMQSPPNQPSPIVGNSIVALGSSQTYSVLPVAGAAYYSWSMPPNWSGTSTTNIINVITGSMSGSVSVIAVNNCNFSSTNSNLFVSVSTSSCAPNQPSAITGNTIVNSGSVETYSVLPVVGATSYIWTLPSGYAGSSTSNTISVTIGATSDVISVVAQNSCGISPTSFLGLAISNTGTATPIINHDWVWAKSTDYESTNMSYDITTDAAGNTYISGVFSTSTIKFGSIVLNKLSPSGYGDQFIAKYDANGNALWAKAIGIDKQFYECAIATDENNNVYMAGVYQLSISVGGVTLTNSAGAGKTSLFLLKFDSQGNVIWAKDADYNSSYLYVNDLAIDSQSNAYITGSFSSQAFTLGSTTLSGFANNNSFLVKYDSGGNVIWAKGTQQTSPSFNYHVNESFGVAIDLLDNIYITGYYSNNNANTLSFGGIPLPNTGNSRCMFLVKYNSLGNVIWAKTSQASSAGCSYGELGRNIVVDLNNNVIVSGNFGNTIVNFDGLSITNTNSPNPYCLADIFLVKYDANGTALLAKKAGGAKDDECSGIACDHFGNIYITGVFESKPANFGNIVLNKISQYSEPVYVAKYDELGNEAWVKYVERTDGYNSYGGGVSADNAGNIYVTGSAYDSHPSNGSAVFGNTTLVLGGVFIAKLGESQVGVNEINNTKESLTLYPNPNTGVFQIKSDVQLKDASIKIHNTQGQTIFESSQFISEIDLSNHPKGIYFIQIKSEDKIINKKIIVQ